MSESDKPNEFLWNTHSYVNEYIRFADTKAELVIGWTSALIGLLFATDFHHRLCQLNVASCIATFGLAVLVLAFVCAFRTVIPRLKTTQKTGYIFWGNILAHKTKDEYVTKVTVLKPDEQNEQVAQHLHDLSNVCDGKFWWVNRSIYLAFGGSLICGVMFLYFDKHPEKKQEQQQQQTENATTHSQPFPTATLR